MSDDLEKRLRATTDGATVNPDGPEAADRIAALEAAVTQCRTLSAMLKPQADRIAELEEELSIWRSVFPDIAPERVLPDRRLLLNRIAELEAALDELIFACELPGDNCEIEQALPRVRAALTGGKDEH